tara:strand:- start:1212 stop:1631 length:420 start_codon:yes stop_codon:yes gene_type:complete
MITFFSEDNFIDERSPIEKGYPSLISPVSYLVGSSYPDIVGYTSYSDMGDFYFVGNTYISPCFRGKGFYGELLSARNELLNDKPKITLVNPIEETDIRILYAQLRKQGGERVESYEEVSDIMGRNVYNELTMLEVFIYR